MHPEIVRDGSGACPICGMALEPLTITAEEPENEELRDMTRRFWTGVALTIPTLAIGMADLIPGLHRGRTDASSMRQILLIAAGVATMFVMFGSSGSR